MNNFIEGIESKIIKKVDRKYLRFLQSKQNDFKASGDFNRWKDLDQNTIEAELDQMLLKPENRKYYDQINIDSDIWFVNNEEYSSGIHKAKMLQPRTHTASCKIGRPGVYGTWECNYCTTTDSDEWWSAYIMRHDTNRVFIIPDNPSEPRLSKFLIAFYENKTIYSVVDGFNKKIQPKEFKEIMQSLNIDDWRKYVKWESLRTIAMNNTIKLIDAIADNDINTVKSLLTGDLIINSVNEHGETPLTAAISFKANEIAKLIIADDRVDVSTPNSFDETPMKLARKKKMTDIVELIQQKIPKKTKLKLSESFNQILNEHGITAPNYVSCDIIGDNKIVIETIKKSNFVVVESIKFKSCQVSVNFELPNTIIRKLNSHGISLDLFVEGVQKDVLDSIITVNEQCQIRSIITESDEIIQINKDNDLPKKSDFMMALNGMWQRCDRHAALILGRFQPFTNGHLKVIESAQEEHDEKEIAICAIVKKKRDEKSPADEDVIRASIEEAIKNGMMDEKIKSCNYTICVEDTGYIPKILWDYAVSGVKIDVVYCGEDRRESYEKQLEEFDDVELRVIKRYGDISATDVRSHIKNNDLDSAQKLSPLSIETLKKFNLDK